MGGAVIEGQTNLLTGSDRDPMKYVRSALAWAKDGYPYKWMSLVRLCEAEAAAGNRRIRRGDVYTLARQHGLTVSECEAFRHDNNLWAALSRYLLMFRPGLACAIFPDPQPWDGVFDLVAEWHAHVSPATPFYIADWRDARGWEG